MDVAQNLIFITSYYIYFLLLMIFVIYAKILNHSSILTIYENFKSLFLCI